MIIALLSDVHANLPALEAVLDDIAGRDGVTAAYHLGDLVGYAPWPDETVYLYYRLRNPLRTGEEVRRWRSSVPKQSPPKSPKRCPV